MLLLPDVRPIPEFFQPTNRLQVELDRRKLPYWSQLGATYFATFQLADAIPMEIQRNWTLLRDQWFHCHPQPWDAEIANQYRENITERIEELLDAGYGSCLLKHPVPRGIVADAMMFFENKRYHLDSFSVMPNHVHALMAPIEPYDLSSVLQAWKSYTSHRLCGQLSIRAPIWSDESFDHLVRNEFHFREYRDYIAQNPSKAHLREGGYTLWQNAYEGLPVQEAHVPSRDFPLGLENPRHFYGQ